MRFTLAILVVCCMVSYSFAQKITPQQTTIKITPQQTTQKITPQQTTTKVTPQQTTQKVTPMQKMTPMQKGVTRSAGRVRADNGPPGILRCILKIIRCRADGPPPIPTPNPPIPTPNPTIPINP